MKKITKLLLLLILPLVVTMGWSYPAQAAPNFNFEVDESDGEVGLQAILNGCYELIDGELVEVEELECDKVYFISAALKNVAEPKYWNPGSDSEYNDELYGIWFQFKLPATISHDSPGRIMLRATAGRRNYDDRWNESEADFAVYAKEGQTLALEFAPGYCDADTMRQINDYHYYMWSEDDCTLVHSDYDFKYSIAAGMERSILLAVRTYDSQEFAAKRMLEATSHLRADFADAKAAYSPTIKAIPILGDVISLRQELDFEVDYPGNGVQKRITVQVELPQWLEQQSSDRWWIETRSKVYAEDGNVCFWVGLYNHEVVYDLDSAATQDIFNPQTLLVHLDGVEAWYFDEAGKKVTLEVSEVMPLPEVDAKQSSSLIFENNGLSANIALDGELASELAGKTIYIGYSYSQIDIAP